MKSMRCDLNINFQIDNSSVQILSFMCGIFQKAIPAHSHGTDCYEIHYIPYGYGKLKADGACHDILPGSLYITGPHILHEQAPIGTDPMQEYCIYLKIKKASKEEASFSIPNLFTAFPFWIGNDKQGIHDIFKNIVNELTCQDTGYQNQLKNLFSQLLIYVVRNYEMQKDTKRQPGSIPPSDIKSMIMDDYFLYEYKNLSLKELSSLLCLSTRQTQRLLKTYYGQTFQEKKTQARMSNAVILLGDAGQSIADIAEQLGYSSPEQFSTAFRSYYGVSPTGFRKQL